MSRDSDAIRILTADDHPLLRDGIAGLIADESDVVLVGEAATGRDAIEQFRRLRPDITLMDLQMPEMKSASGPRPAPAGSSSCRAARRQRTTEPPRAARL